ncbi:taste receptor type 2 member 40-like [Dendrobates tinctorius]|uniref:taste receptor type 2 member 40-like n=1 Tax=Dendrobates tinctorius TaxID=92724 RepID=UPI003CCA668B
MKLSVLKLIHDSKLAGYLLFPDLTDKGLTDISYGSDCKEMLILQSLFPNGNIQSTLHPPNHCYTNRENPTSLQIVSVCDTIWCIASLESEHLQLSVIWNEIPSHPLHDSIIRNKYTRRYVLGASFSQIYVPLAGDLQKPSHLVIMMIQLIYQYQQFVMLLASPPQPLYTFHAYYNKADGIYCLGVLLRKTSEIFKLQDEGEVSAESDQGQTLPTFVIVSISALAISTVIGFITNSFIILVHGLESAKARSINPKELILFTQGLINIAFQCTMVANDTLLFLWSDLYFSHFVYTIFSIILLLTIFSSFWFTFCLCGFYYIMLVTFEKTLFMCLKKNISQIVPWMLLFCTLLSIVISVPVAWNINKVEYFDISAGNMSGNFTMQLSLPEMSRQYLLVTSIIGCCMPLILVAIANVLIVQSLCSHVQHLRKSSGGISVQSLEASVSAARTVTCLLLLYISFYVCETLLIMDVFKVDSPWISLCLVTVYSYAPVQSVILINGSPNLRDRIKSIICSSKRSERKSPGGRTNSSSSITSLNISHSVDRTV